MQQIGYYNVRKIVAKGHCFTLGVSQLSHRFALWRCAVASFNVRYSILHAAFGFLPLATSLIDMDESWLSNINFICNLTQVILQRLGKINDIYIILPLFHIMTISILPSYMRLS